jgi:hypothetical protein
MDRETQEYGAGIGRMVLIFLLRFLAVSIPLYVIYAWAGDYYTRFLALCTGPLLSIAGVELTIDRALTVTEEISLNPVVFLSLVIAVQRIGWRKKLWATAFGIVILTVANIAVLFLLFMSAHRENEGLWTGTEFLNLTINFFLPLLLWFVLLPLRSVSDVMGKKKDAPKDVS